MDIKALLENVKNGNITIEDAELELKKAPFVDIGIAKLDMHRKLRQGCAEVIYGEGKSADQLVAIISTLLSQGQDLILITRVSKEKYEHIAKHFDVEYDEDARIVTVGKYPNPDGRGRVVICSAGTSDYAVAREAELTLKALGNDVLRLNDVGVAGLHRLLAHLDELMSATVVIAIAGMEGALASVIGGLVDVPVIACPTSVGYGASFEGLAALLSMLNSCSSGVSVVNIDNGFGSGFLASRINHIGV